MGMSVTVQPFVTNDFFDFKMAHDDAIFLKSFPHKRSRSVPFSLQQQPISIANMKMTTKSMLCVWASSLAIVVSAWVTKPVVRVARSKVVVTMATLDDDSLTRIHKSSEAEHHLEEMQQVWQDLQQKEKQVEVSHDKVGAHMMCLGVLLRDE